MATKKAAAAKETTLNEDVKSPATVAPGDAPADTTDPTEEATSVTPDKAAAASDGHGTVNAVQPVKRKQAAKRSRKDRTETYKRTRPNGDEVTVWHNIDTGETRVES